MAFYDNWGIIGWIIALVVVFIAFKMFNKSNNKFFGGK